MKTKHITLLFFGYHFSLNFSYSQPSTWEPKLRRPRYTSGPLLVPILPLMADTLGAGSIRTATGRAGNGCLHCENHMQEGRMVLAAG
jgi:hypothetical protein